VLEVVQKLITSHVACRILYA